MDDLLRRKMDNKELVYEKDLQVPVHILDYRHDDQLNTFDIHVVTCDGELPFHCYPEDLDFEMDCHQFIVA